MLKTWRFFVVVVLFTQVPTRPGDAFILLEIPGTCTAACPVVSVREAQRIWCHKGISAERDPALPNKEVSALGKVLCCGMDGGLWLRGFPAHHVPRQSFATGQKPQLKI